MMRAPNVQMIEHSSERSVSSDEESWISSSKISIISLTCSTSLSSIDNCVRRIAESEFIIVGYQNAVSLFEPSCYPGYSMRILVFQLKCPLAKLLLISARDLTVLLYDALLQVVVQRDIIRVRPSQL
ncbi:hypothetical protein TMatcc_002088 [Talaromyces marneffei ATCC 18224]